LPAGVGVFGGRDLSAATCDVSLHAAVRVLRSLQEVLLDRRTACTGRLHLGMGAAFHRATARVELVGDFSGGVSHVGGDRGLRVSVKEVLALALSAARADARGVHRTGVRGARSDARVK
jgi:hypothetical protein